MVITLAYQNNHQAVTHTTNYKLLQKIIHHQFLAQTLVNFPSTLLLVTLLTADAWNCFIIKHAMKQTFGRKFSTMQKKQNRIRSLACLHVINRRSVSSNCVHSDNCTCPGNIQSKWRLSCETYSECQGQRISRRSDDILPARISNIYWHNL